MEAVKVFVLTVIVFGALIFVHELGHFLACRIFGVKVNEFAIGMGPKLISFKGKKSSTEAIALCCTKLSLPKRRC